MKNNRMRAAVSLVAASVILTVTGCGGDNSGGTASTSAAPAATGGSTAASDANTTTASPDPSKLDENATFRFGVQSAIATLDPIKSTSPSTYYMYYDPMFDTLVRAKPDGTLAPGIATQWSLSDDAKTFTMTIAQGRTFQDGTPIDAVAVKANLDRAVNDPKSTAKTALSKVQSITAAGNTVTITVSSEGGRLPSLLSDNAGMMVAPASFGTSQIDTAPIGSGPFKIKSFGPSSTTYERWDGYYDAKDTHLAGIEIVVLSEDATRFAALRSGQVDAAPIALSQVSDAKSAGFKLASSVQNAFDGLSLNTSNEALGKPDVRNALMHAIDRDTIDKALYGGECVPTVQPYSTESWAFDSTIKVTDYGAYDTAKAKDLLRAAGYPNGFDLKVDVVQLPTYTKLFEVLQEELGAIGVHLTSRMLPPVEFLQSLTSGGADAWVLPHSSGRPDALFYWNSRYMKGGQYNPANFAPPRIAELFDVAASTLDAQKQLDAIHGMIKESLDGAPRIIPVCAYKAYAAASKNVSGLTFPPSYNFEFRKVSMTKS